MAVTFKPQRVPATHTAPHPSSPPDPAHSRLGLPWRPRAARTALGVMAGAGLLWALTGVGFVNYDTLYGLVWGQQLAHGGLPQYGVPFAPTPHPLVELLGISLTPLGAHLTTDVTVGLAFLALSACAWVLYRLGREWFGPLAGAVGGAVLLTRVPILSYGVRAYVDIPYMLLVLLALLLETRRPRAGAPVLGVLALAGLLRPEAWVFSGAYWVYLLLASRTASGAERRTRGQLAGLGLLAAGGPIVWVLSDLLVTGDPLWSLANTRSMAHQLNRTTGIGNVPEYIPRRIGEILRPAGLAGAALGGVLSLLWLGPRARLGAGAGVLAVGAFAATAAFGLPIDTRYAFLASSILSVFCGAGVFGWVCLPAGGIRRRVWMGLGTLVLVALFATLPTQLHSAQRELSKLRYQQQVQDDMLALASNGPLSSRCGEVGVPSHVPIPLLALYLATPPSRIVDTQAHSGQPGGAPPVQLGSYLDPASRLVEEEYVLSKQDRTLPASIPPGFTEAGANRSWLLFEHCA